MGRHQLLLGFFLGFGVLFTVVISASLLGRAGGGHWNVHPAVGIAVIYGVLAVWLTFVARMYLTGIFVNDHGLRLRYVFFTRTLPWATVTGFDVRPARIFDTDTDRQACWVSTTSGTYETPVQLSSGTAALQKRSGPVLPADDFNRMVDQLERHRRSRGH